MKLKMILQFIMMKILKNEKFILIIYLYFNDNLSQKIIF